jgi:hypothetical protein
VSLLRLNLLDGLPSGDAVVLVILMSFVAACGCVLLYVLVRGAIDLLAERRMRRVERETWLAEQARIHRETG